VSSRDAIVHHGDGIRGLLSLDPGSVDLVLSDLPSGETAAPFDVKPDLSALWLVMWSVLKPNGIAVLMASSLRFAAELSQLEHFRYDLIWRKSAASGFYNAAKRPLRNHEFVLVFWREEGTYNPQMRLGSVPISSNRAPGGALHKPSRGVNYGKAAKSTRSRAGELERFPVSVLEFGSVPNAQGRLHPQQKPLGLCQNLVRQYSNPGELVVDPFAGSFTVGAAALREGRRFIGWDSQAEFAVIGNERLGQRSLFEVQP